MAYKYIGGKWGGFIPGIPARDLSAKDIEVFDIDAAILDASPLYEKAKKKRAKPQVHSGDDDRAERE
jgi:hypothetical protein